MNAVLDPIRHQRIIADLDHVCTLAGVQPKFLRESMKEHCGTGEVASVHKRERIESRRRRSSLTIGGLDTV
jgi:hypothetical protein